MKDRFSTYAMLLLLPALLTVQVSGKAVADSTSEIDACISNLRKAVQQQDISLVAKQVVDDKSQPFNLFVEECKAAFLAEKLRAKVSQTFGVDASHFLIMDRLDNLKSMLTGVDLKAQTTKEKLILVPFQVAGSNLKGTICFRQDETATAKLDSAETYRTNNPHIDVQRNELSIRKRQALYQSLYDDLLNARIASNEAFIQRWQEGMSDAITTRPQATSQKSPPKSNTAADMTEPGRPVLGPLVHNLQISMTVLADGLQEGSVILKLSTKNVGTDPISINRTVGVYPYIITILSDTGEVPKKRYGKLTIDAPTLKNAEKKATILKPGESIDDEIPCSRLFDMPMFGIYKIVISHNIMLQHDDKPIVVPAAVAVVDIE